jgi:ribosomal protein S18 acetylase RimI-like enzyme
MILRPFKANDFPIYRSWFSDEELNAALGPMDQEWLSHILEDKQGGQFVLEAEGQIRAVVGVIWPRTKSERAVITDIAADPNQRRKGFGRTALALLLQSSQGKSFQWMAYVDVSNTKAQAFFTCLGWQAGKATDMVPFFCPDTP